MSFKEIKESLRYRIGYVQKGLMNRFNSTDEVFTSIYKNNKWQSAESRSGHGSTLEQTHTIRKELPKLFRELKISSLLDIPCGDFNWMKEIDLSFLTYIGADIVKEVIIKNNSDYAKEKRKFVVLNIIKDKVPCVDLIFCRDLLQHFSNKDIFQTLKTIKESKSKYLLTSSQLDTQKNLPCVTGSYRPLNLLLPPFSFPEPLKIIEEKNPKNEFRKSLLLWHINKI